MSRKRRRKKNSKNLLVFVIIVILLIIYNFYGEKIEEVLLEKTGSYASYNIESIPPYNGKDYVIINDNKPMFDDKDKTTESFEEYNELDMLGRATYAYANIGIDLVPTLDRTSIGSIKPTGFKTVKYDIIEGKYLYNRCHLIGYQLTGENANKRNLITCTRQMNIGVMLDYENMVKKYIEDTRNHVLYRVTPIYEESNLVAIGVELEGYSVEDKGEGIEFNIFIYNVQDGIEIDYKTGDSKLKD